jgi:molybdenum cofactor cytidylyltransferase
VIRGLLLCGGKSSRFGSDKLLVRHSRGGGNPARAEPLVVYSARNLIAGAGNALAVVPLGATDLRRALESAGCDILETKDTQRGLGASLAAGVAASTGAAGWIVALGDMPFIRAASIAAVRASLENGALIAAPIFGGTKRGHPVGFSGKLEKELLALGADEGARSIIEQHRAALVTVAVDDAGILADIDTPGDLESYRGVT